MHLLKRLKASHLWKQRSIPLAILVYVDGGAQFAAQPYSKLRFHGFYPLLPQSDKRALVGYSVALEPKLHLRLESPWCGV